MVVELSLFSINSAVPEILGSATDARSNVSLLPVGMGTGSGSSLQLIRIEENKIKIPPKRCFE